MAVIPGTVTGITHLNTSAALNGNGDEKTVLVTADFAAYDASADTGSLAAIGTAIQNATRDGKTVTLRAAHGVGPGVSDGGADVFFGAMTVSSDDLTFSLTAVDRSTEVDDFTTAVGVSAVVTYTES